MRDIAPADSTRVELDCLLTAIRLLGVPVVEYDRHLRYVWANDAYCRLVGRPAGRAGRAEPRRGGGRGGVRPRRAVHPGVLCGERVDYETEIELPAAGCRRLHSILEPTRDARGEVDGWIGIAEDITERRRTEQARRHLAAIVEGSDDGIVGKTLDGIVTSWNAGAERLFGYAAEEMIGQPIRRIVPFDRRDDVTHILSAIRAGRRVHHYETERIRKDGTRLHVSLTVSPILDADGRVVGASKIARDVTARRRAEDALHETLDLLATLNRTSALISAELDLTRLVQTVTDAATQVTGARFGAFFYDVGERGARNTPSTRSPASRATSCPSFRGSRARRSSPPRFAARASSASTTSARTRAGIR